MKHEQQARAVVEQLKTEYARATRALREALRSYLDKGETPDPVSAAQVRQAAAWVALRDWHIRQQVLRNRR